MKDQIITFGNYIGKPFSSIPDSYMGWLAKPVYSGKFYRSLHSTDLKFKVPLKVTIAARQEMERRGYHLIGERWEK
jgi:hypothetical protein